jgi:hypothetical protein
LKEKLKTKNAIQLFCVTQTFDNHLICQARIKTSTESESSPFDYFLKIDLTNKKLVKLGKINNWSFNRYRGKEQNYFNEITNITPIKNSNLFISNPDDSSFVYLIDTESLSVQPLNLPGKLTYGGVTESGDIIAFDNKTIQCIPFSEIKAFLSMHKQQTEKERTPILNQFIYPIDLVKIVNEYADDYCAEAKRFNNFYKSKNLINDSIENPFNLKSETLHFKRVFK